MEDKNEEALLKYLPLIGAVLIFAGVIRLMFYYSFFNINIITFLDFGEIITSFFDILVMFIIQAILVLINILMISKVEEMEIVLNKKGKLSDGKGLRKRPPIYFEMYTVLVVIGFILILTLCILDYFSDFVTKKIYLLFLGCYFSSGIITVLSLELRLKLKELEATVNNRHFTILLFNAFALLFLVMFYSYYQVVDTNEGKSYYGVSFQLDSKSTIISDSTNYFIGKTQKYLFFYHQALKKTDVFPIERISQFTFVSR